MLLMEIYVHNSLNRKSNFTINLLTKILLIQNAFLCCNLAIETIPVIISRLRSNNPEDISLTNNLDVPKIMHPNLILQ